MEWVFKSYNKITTSNINNNKQQITITNNNKHQ